MPDLILSTLNARYIHASFGLRYLMANLDPDLRARAEVLEFVIKDDPVDVVARVLARAPRVVGFGVYIWNVRETLDVVAILKQLRPDIAVILGGPEVSHETEGQPLVALADAVVCGEADVVLSGVARRLLAGERVEPKVIHAEPPPFDMLTMPYDLYTDEDIHHRVVYVEASRGCPFRCEFCLSSLPGRVRKPPLEAFLAAMERLLDRGVMHFKFVDRTFNLDLASAEAILTFFLDRHKPGMFVHFELIPDRLPEALRAIIARFPPGALQFEVGVQTLDPDVERRISRRQDHARLADNLTFLRDHTGVHVHADLIVGLPGEDLDTFARGFDRLLDLGPDEIQVGILKRLKGTPIARHDRAFGMRYSPAPPYAVLATDAMDFGTILRMTRFAKVWDLLVNSGNFPNTAPAIWRGRPSAFRAFLEVTDAFHARFERAHAVALRHQLDFLFAHLTATCGHDPEATAAALFGDYARGGRNDIPPCLRPHLSPERAERIRRANRPPRELAANPAAERQARHQI